MAEMKKALHKIRPYVPGKPTEELKRELKLDRVYKLASNEIPFPPAYVSAAVRKEIALLNRYPEGSCFYLRRAVAKKLGVNEDQLVFGNGSDELLVMAMRAFLEKGDGMIVGFPSFLIYEIEGAIEEAEITRVPFKDYRYDLEGMAKLITKDTRMVIIANPDNPHGTYVSQKEVNAFLQKIPDDLLVIFDEAYYEFVEAPDYPRTLDLIKARGNVIVTRTFSKAYGLAGLRIGYGVTTPEIAAVLNTVRDPFNVNRIAQVSACAALGQKQFLRKVKTCVRQGKKYLYREFDALGLKYVKSQTNFILIDFRRDTAELNRYLLKNGVIVRMMNGWGLNNFFRVTVGLPKENKAFIKALKQFMKNSARAR